MKLEINAGCKKCQFYKAIDTMHTWLPIKNYFVSIKISPTNVLFELIYSKEFLFLNETNWANLNANI